MKDEELIWVDKEFAAQFNKAKEEGAQREQQLQMLNEYMSKLEESTRKEFKTHLDSISEDAAMYTGLLLQVKQAFGKAKQEHIDKTYELWENFEHDLPILKQKVQTFIDVLNPLAVQLKVINTEVAKISNWEIEKLLNTIKEISSLYDDSKDMVQFLVNNYRPKEV